MIQAEEIQMSQDNMDQFITEKDHSQSHNKDIEEIVKIYMTDSYSQALSDHERKNIKPAIEEKNCKNDISNYFQKKEANCNVTHNDMQLLFTSKHKRLKKKAEAELQKKINKKISFSQFFDIEAELGSDDENHDDVIKKPKDDDEENDNDEKLNHDLNDLIDDDNDNENENNDALQEKFFIDMLEKDKEEVKKVIMGPDKKEMLHFKRSRLSGNQGIGEIDDMPLQMRLRKYKSDNANQDNVPEFNFNLLFKNFKNIEKRISECEDNCENEELKEMLQEYENNFYKKFSDHQNLDKKDMYQRIKENDKILENVINLNSELPSNEAKSTSLLVKGSYSCSSKDSNSLFLPFVSPFSTNLEPKHSWSSNTLLKSRSFSNVAKIKYGTHFNSNNSFLHAMKNDKYYNRSENETLHPNSNENSSLSVFSCGSTASSGKKEQICPIFSANLNISSSMLGHKNANLTALFKKGSKMKFGFDAHK